MGGSIAGFRPNAVLTSGALARLVAGLTDRPVAAVPDPSAPVTIAELDGRLVRGLHLGSAASGFARAARQAGLAPPTRFGTEVAARLLGLRANHPAAQDNLELLPGDPATRADAAYSAARILGFSGNEVTAVKDAATTLALPAVRTWQQRVLRTAVHFIGYPYVWGGTSESVQTLFGVTSRGGFDCSGFVWRVFKLQAYTGGRRLSGVFRGRGAGDMAGEVPRALRIPFAQLEPGDVLFFGAHGRKSRPSEVNHASVYVGGGWMIQSSGQGVALAPLAGWYRQRFAWARRPLAEAGLI
jgi:cell wall-associated NlpC family hydrolase